MGKIKASQSASNKSPQKTKASKKASPTKEIKKVAKTLPTLRASTRLKATKVASSPSGGDDEEEGSKEDQDFSTDGDSVYENTQSDSASSVGSPKGGRKRGEVAAGKSTSRTPLQAAMDKHLDGKYITIFSIFLYFFQFEEVHSKNITLSQDLRRAQPAANLVLSNGLSPRAAAASLRRRGLNWGRL
jgi:hypothetical protein